MPLDAPVNTFTGRGVSPLYDADDALCLNVNLPPSVTYSKGQILALITDTANDVQTVTVDATGGTFTLTITLNGVSQTTAAIAEDAAAATVQTALRALTLIGSNCSVTGSAGGPFTVTFNSQLAGTPIPVMTGSATLLTGGASTVTIAHTTTGRSAGTYVAYDGTKLTPTTAPTVAGNGSGSSFAAGTYAVSYTYVTALGESTPSPATFVTLTAAQNARVSAISSLNANVTAVNYYVNGVWAKQTVPSSGTAAQTDISGATLTTGQSAPSVGTAYAIAAGSGCQIPKAILRFDCATDANGYATFGASSSGGSWGESSRGVPAWFSGDFQTSELTGLDANALATWPARLLSGTTSSGIVRVA